MSRQPVILSALAATLMLSACARPPANGPGATAPEAPGPAAQAPAPGALAEAMPCNAGAVQSLVGREATADVLEQARIDSGAAMVRALRPGEAATMDFRPDRLDVSLDEAGIIRSLHCG